MARIAALAVAAAGAAGPLLLHLGTGGALVHLGLVALVVAGVLGAVWSAAGGQWGIAAAAVVAAAGVGWLVRRRLGVLGSRSVGGMGRMESFTHRHDGEGPAHETRGRLLDRGWRYDLEVWLLDKFVLRGRVRALRRRVIELTELRAGSALLDVGCGTGTLAIAAAAEAGPTGRAAGIDPAPRQIARARSKAKRAGAAVDFQTAVIEAIPFPDGSFDAVTSTLMLHHLPGELKQRGLSEIARVLRVGGRLVVADFDRSSEEDGAPRRQGSGGAAEAISELVRSAGFTGVRWEEVPFPAGAHRGWTGAAIVSGTKA